MNMGNWVGSRKLMLFSRHFFIICMYGLNPNTFRCRRWGICVHDGAFERCTRKSLSFSRIQGKTPMSKMKRVRAKENKSM